MSETPDSRVAVLAALSANLVLAGLKGVAFAFTGSASMLSEAFHSVADCFNQVTLWIGMRSARRGADAEHPYGYGRSGWAWAVVSAMGVLFVGAGVSVFNGIEKLLHPEPLQHLPWAVGVMGVALVLEGGSFALALRSVQRSARSAGMSLWGYLRRGSDPAGVAVVVEDGAAVVGVGLGVVAISAALYTGNPHWDAVGSIVIGLLLAVSALFLTRRNLDLLVGRAIPDRDLQHILRIMNEEPTVGRVLDVKTTVLGPGHFRFKAEITLDSAVLAQRFLADNPDLEGELEPVLARFADGLLEDVGDEIDALEARIHEEVPSVRHIDLELD